MIVPRAESPIEKGIAVFFPYKRSLEEKIIELEIEFFLKNPRMNILQCDTSPSSKIWSARLPMYEPGAIFLFKEELRKGFYLVRARVPVLGISNKEIYTILSNEKRLIVGLPYSAYSPISL